MSHIWAPITAYGLLGLFTAIAARTFRSAIPDAWVFKIGADSIDSLLNILASSMLAVTTFSVSIMITAFTNASGSATPRASLLLKADSTAQRVLASFIGAFIFSLVGIISLQIGVYGEGGRVILFAATIFVLALIVVNLVRWIGHLTDFGRLADTVDRVETAAKGAMKERLRNPWMGARPLADRTPPAGAVPIRAQSVGHIQFINLQDLNARAEKAGCTVMIAVTPGTFVDAQADLAHVVGGPVGPDFDDLLAGLHACFEIGMTRSFDQDPRFGMITLSEIASRALSPAVNDPGTAIDVIRRVTRVLSLWDTAAAPQVTYPHLAITGLQASDMMRDAFAAPARDGAALYEVQVALQRSLLALARLDPLIFAAAADDQAARAMVHARGAMAIDADLTHLQAIADQTAALVPGDGGDVLSSRT
ncbi:DUF2254 domain-containing protein [Loktanella fryxellensis]|nr:DUF2254 domain-containing protein [Loktanella fryxellensis]